MQVGQADYTELNARPQFNQSLLDTGFAVIRNHPIDYNLVKEVFEEWRGFFASTYKNNYVYHNDTQDGLFPINVSETAVGYNIKDIKEFYHFYPWGQFPKELSDKTKMLYAQMNAVAQTLLQWIEDSLPANVGQQLAEPLTNMIEGSQSTLMRILHYPPLTGQEEAGAVRAGAHTDINLITILVAASESGLQVRDKYDNWLDVPVDPGMLAINIGDMLQEATDGIYKSTAHRVVNPSGEKQNKSRFSIPLFLHPRPEVVLSKRYTAGQFLQERLIALGTKKV